MTKPRKPKAISRRRLLSGAAASPFAASALFAGCGGPDASDGPTLAALERANTLLDHRLPPGRPAAILPAVRMNHAFFRAVRELDIPDLTEPAIRFVARGPAAEGPES